MSNFERGKKRLLHLCKIVVICFNYLVVSNYPVKTISF